MANFCNNSFIVSGPKHKLQLIMDILDSLPNDGAVFATLVNGTDSATEEEMIAFYGTKCDVPKSALEFMLDEDYGIIGNMETAWQPPSGFYQKLSEKYEVKVDATYDSVNDDVKGTLVYANGTLLLEQQYTYMEGMYRLDTDEEKSDFWYELEIKTEDEYRDSYESAQAVIEAELNFLNDDERERFQEMF